MTVPIARAVRAAQSSQVFDDLAKQGYRLLQVSACAIDVIGGSSQVLYAGIRDKSPGPAYQARIGLTARITRHFSTSSVARASRFATSAARSLRDNLAAAPSAASGIARMVGVLPCPEHRPPLDHLHRRLPMSATSRLLTHCFVWLTAIVAVGGCASAGGGAPPPLASEDVMLPSPDAGISLFLRNKAPAGMTAFSGAKTVLFVHGATYPSEIAFDLKLGGQSWMDYIASRGYDVWLVDVRGYGRSSKTTALSQPADANRPFANTEDAVRDVSMAVDYILKRRGIDKLNLIGWSWGTTTMATYTTRHNDRVNKLVLYAPVWTPPTVGTPPPPPTAAYRAVTMDAARQRWYSGVPADKQAALIPPGWFDTWARAALDSDPEGAKLSPPVLRAPNGTLVDILGGWLLGKRLYEAEQIRVPTLLIKAEWDVDTPAFMAQGLFANLKNTPYKAYVEIGEGTHTVMMEKNRMQLFRPVQAFLDDPAPR